ncbi:uncharacterized protein LOC123507053 isoform X2 [Portunus trituberculatus]|uniref:uncharacterized protein LOC123507053 isoform X2 n=1 Tax=Portunus trituberculatus TaxID=210409 RepID=UPI001E1D0BB5|nr:uncharacterized protein LOC123507053 isoform X2 [Portunus trituberculatus]
MSCLSLRASVLFRHPLRQVVLARRTLVLGTTMVKNLSIFSLADLKKLLSEVEMENKKNIPTLDDALKAIKKQAEDGECDQRRTWAYICEYIREVYDHKTDTMPPESIPASCNEVNLPHRPSGSVEVVSKQDPVLLSTLAFPPRPSSIVPLVLCEEDSLPFPSPQVATSQSVKRLRPQINNDCEDGQPDDTATLVIPFSAAPQSQEGGCYGTSAGLTSGQTQLNIGQNSAVQQRPSGMVDVPTLTNLEGKYGFTVSVDDKERSTKSPMWLMSTIVNKLYTNLNKAVPFEVRMNNPPTDDEKMYIRAILVFSSPEFLRTNVIRCPNHAAIAEATNHDFPYPNHVVRADHPAALYQESPSGRLSVVVPLDLHQNSPDYALILLRFMCLGSCVGGINRRPISIVLTLENGQAEVLGRKVIDVRVCACPTRDIRTDEQTVSNRGVKRKGSSTQAQQIIKKKPKMVEPKLDLDEGSQEVFNIKVQGRQLYTFMLNMMRVYYSTHPEYAVRYPDPTLAVNSSIRQKNTSVKEKTSRTDIVEENNINPGRSAGSSPVHDGNLVIDSQESPPHASSSQLHHHSIPSTMNLVVMKRETNGLDSINVQHSNIKSSAQILNLAPSIPIFSSPSLSTTKVVPLIPTRPQLTTTQNDVTTPPNGSLPRHIPFVPVQREASLRRVNSDSKIGSVRLPLALKSSSINNVAPASTNSVALELNSTGQNEKSSHDSEEMLAANVLADISRSRF